MKAKLQAELKEKDDILKNHKNQTNTIKVGLFFIMAKLFYNKGQISHVVVRQDLESVASL